MRSRQTINRPNFPKNIPSFTISEGPSFVVPLGGSKVIKEIPAQQVSLSEIEVIQFIDSPSRKTVEAFCKKFGRIVLWEGDDYDAIGDWTNADVTARLNQIYQ